MPGYTDCYELDQGGLREGLCSFGISSSIGSDLNVNISNSAIDKETGTYAEKR